MLALAPCAPPLCEGAPVRAAVPVVVATLLAHAELEHNTMCNATHTKAWRITVKQHKLDIAFAMALILTESK